MHLPLDGFENFILSFKFIVPIFIIIALGAYVKSQL